MARTNWTIEKVTVAVEWWHSGLSAAEASRYMDETGPSIAYILDRVAMACCVDNKQDLRRICPKEQVRRFQIYRSEAASRRGKGPDSEVHAFSEVEIHERLRVSNTQHLALLAQHHPVMFNGQPVPAEAREKARTVLKEGKAA